MEKTLNFKELFYEYEETKLRNQKQDQIDSIDSGVKCPNCDTYSMTIRNYYRVCEKCDYTEYND